MENNHSLRVREGQRMLINGCPFEVKEITHRALHLEPIKRVRYTVACDVMQIHAWPEYPLIQVNGRLLDGNEELAPVVEQFQADAEFHPRAAELMRQRRDFLVIPIWRTDEKADHTNPVVSVIRLWGRRMAGWISRHAGRDAVSRGG